MKNALITGGAKRLGAAIAEYLALQGYNIAIHYFQSKNEAQALARKLSSDHHIKAVIVGGDLCERTSYQNIMDEASSALAEPLDTLVNNASTMEFDRIDKPLSNEFEIWDKNFRTNLEAPYFLTRAFAAQCVDKGVVVNMIDQRVLRLTPNYASYTLAKSALYTLTKTAAMALAPHIRVNAIGPGTTLIGAHQSQENFEHHRKISILEMGANIEDITGALGYLLDAKTVTGQMIAVDGGQHLIWELPTA